MIAEPFGPVGRGEALGRLASIAAMDGDEKADAAAELVAQLAAGGADQVTMRAVRQQALRHKMMRAGDFDAIERDNRPAPAPRAVEHQDGELPDGAREVPGSPGWAYRPASAADAGALYKRAGRSGWQLVTPWAPAVARVMESANEVGDTTARYFEVVAGGRPVVASADELTTAEPWLLLPVPGTGARATREVLVNVVFAEAAALGDTEPALTRTGWHGPPEGRFYVFADGRTSVGGRVRLIGPSRAMSQLAAAVAPVEPAACADVAAALARIAEHGDGPALAGLGIGVRSLGQSLHKVLGGYVFAGRPNAGKSNAAWHARTLLVARAGRANAWPPLPSATFADTAAYVEGVFDTEADMPVLFDDAAVYAGSSRTAENAVAELLEKTYRPLANDAPVKGRSSQSMLPRASRFVRSPVIATVQEAPMQNSLRRRVLVLPVEPGDVDVTWYRGPSDRPGAHAAALVRPLRTLGEHLVIPHLAQLADAPGYLAARDGEALDMLGAQLDAAAPGWQSSAEGLAGVAELAGCVLAGLLIAADALPGLRAELVTEPAAAYLVRAVAAQAALMADASAAEAPGPALADVLRFALLNGRAHICEDHGEPSPVIPGLSLQEQGLELVPGRRFAEDEPGVYRGRGVPLYWLPDLGGLGVSGANLHKLITEAADPRLRSRGERGLPRQLDAAGLIVPSASATGPSTTHQHWANGANSRLVVIRADVVLMREHIEVSAGSARSARSARPQVEVDESNTDSAEVPSGSARPQVEAGIAALGVPVPDVLASPSDVAPSTSSTSAAGEVLEPPAEALCMVCGGPLWPALAALGETTHAGCDPRSGAPEPAPPGPAELPLTEPAEPEAAAAATARPAASAADRGPAFLVWDGGELAHAPEGELVPVPRGSLAACRDVGALAALALDLHTRRLYVTRAAREALGLPAELPDVERPGQGVPHPFADADRAVWDVWPGDPVGLGAWMSVYTLPRSGDGAAVVFAEWLTPPSLDGPAFGELAPAELAHALTLIWKSTTFTGNGSRYGGVHFHHSPQATFKRFAETRMRRSKRGIPGAPELPLVYGQSARARGASLTIPGPHMAPAQEIPAGWVVAALDINACYPAAARSTEFPVGEWRELRPGQLDKKMPGIHLCSVPTDAAAIHPALMPWFPAPKRGQREGRAWLDGLAALWLAERDVPLRTDISYIWPETEGRRVFDSPIREVLAARDQLAALDGAPAQLARDVMKAGYARFLGGWLGSDAWQRAAGDWTDNRAWWLRVRVQAEVRKQRNLVPMLAAGAIVLGQDQVDTVWIAAPSLDVLAELPGTGRRPALGDGPGKFKLTGHGAVTPELAAQLADGHTPAHARRAAIVAALDSGKGDQS